MFCKNCGQRLSDEARFCSNCGEPVSDVVKMRFCVVCGTQMEAAARFCPVCGMRADPEETDTSVRQPVFGEPTRQPAFGEPTRQTAFGEPARQPVPEEPVRQAAFAEPVRQPVAEEPVRQTQTPLMPAKMFSLYEGEPTIGIAKCTGTLTVYGDRLEFKKQLGNAVGGAFGLVGMAVSRSRIKEDPLLIFPLSQVLQLRTGKYGGVYNTLVLVMRDGTTVSLCPAVPGSSFPQEIVNRLHPYMQ